MSKPYTGGCACGAIRYEISDEPVAMGDCQCLDCRKRGGTGHNSYLTFPDKQKVKLDGKGTVWDVAADNGNVKHHAFCPTCGTPVYLTFAYMPDFFTVHAGTLDDPGRYRPQFVTYTIRALDWDPIDPGAQRFEKMPPM